LASYPSTTSIVGVALDYPKLTNQLKNSSSTSNWTQINAGDVIDFFVNSNTDVQSVGLFLVLERLP
jgi:hypothetical protein